MRLGSELPPPSRPTRPNKQEISKDLLRLDAYANCQPAVPEPLAGRGDLVNFAVGESRR